MPEPDPGERFTALYDTYHPRVHAYAVSRAGRQLAEEVTSETFCVAWRRLADMPKAELPWLLAVARNILREQYRAEVTRRSLDAELRIWTAESADDIADHVTDRAQVLAALRTLSDDDRELLILVAWHGLKPREAARVVGCSTATYHVRLHRARKRLERALSAPPLASPSNPTPILATGKEAL